MKIVLLLLSWPVPLTIPIFSLNVICVTAALASSYASPQEPGTNIEYMVMSKVKHTHAM